MRCCIALILCLAGCESLENHFVFHPIATDPRAVPPLPEPLADVFLQTADGTKIHARWCPRGQSRDVLLYCPGNAGNLESRGKLMRDFWASLDRSVLIFDYPGFGQSEGRPSEKGCYAAASAAYDWLTHNKNISPERIVIAGESLGGGVAVDLASTHPHQALVLIRTFTSVPDIAKQQTVLASAPAFMVNRFESLKKISNCKSPILIAQADKDRIMPYSHAEELRGAATAPARIYRLQGLDHNDPLPPSFFVELQGFLADVERGWHGPKQPRDEMRQ